MIFQTAYSSSESQLASPSSSGHKVGTHPGQDTLPSQDESHTYPHSLRLGQCRHFNSPHVHIFEMWKEAAVPEKTHADIERTQTLHR